MGSLYQLYMFRDGNTAPLPSVTVIVVFLDTFCMSCRVLLNLEAMEVTFMTKVEKPGNGT